MKDREKDRALCEVGQGRGVGEKRISERIIDQWGLRWDFTSIATTYKFPPTIFRRVLSAIFRYRSYTIMCANGTG
jgi:hypothetical protein